MIRSLKSQVIELRIGDKMSALNIFIRNGNYFCIKIIISDTRIDPGYKRIP